MSAEDYGYATYDEMFRHAEHHGGGIDADANAVEWVVSQLDSIAQPQPDLRAVIGKAITDLIAIGNGMNWDGLPMEYANVINDLRAAERAPQAEQE